MLNLYITSINQPVSNGPDEDWAWRLLSAARDRGRGLNGKEELNFAVAASGDLLDADAVEPGATAIAELRWRDGRWALDCAEAASPLIDLYLGCCNVTAERPLIVGHLGQSLDGYIATATGDSDFVTGRANITHLHRMRALCDAVVVGAGTVESDDPRLTTRHVEGPSPVRVVLDPKRRLAEDLQMFRDDEALSLLVAADTTKGPDRHGRAEVIPIAYCDGKFELKELIAALHGRGLHSIFIEGGGATVSAFLAAGLLDRLQITIAPMFTGRGQAGVRLEERDRIADCLRPAHRVFAMGQDLLFDCDLRIDALDSEGSLNLRRIV